MRGHPKAGTANAKIVCWDRKATMVGGGTGWSKQCQPLGNESVLSSPPFSFPSASDISTVLVFNCDSSVRLVLLVFILLQPC